MGGLFSSDSPTPQKSAPPPVYRYSFDENFGTFDGFGNRRTHATRSSSTTSNSNYYGGTYYGSGSSSNYGRNATGSYSNNNRSQWSSVTDREVEDLVQNYNRLVLTPRKEELKVSKLDRGLFSFCSFPVSYTELNSYDDDYLIISRLVTNKKHFKIDAIERINNPFLENAYNLKKLQKQQQHGYVQEKFLFHGTKQRLVDEICKFNFDYRKIVKHKYGKGVSFSTNSTYASNYSDQDLYDKVMLVAKVLIANSCIGNEHLTVPPSGYDTTQKGLDGVVTVKYDDSEYYPAYKIRYHTVGEMNHFKEHQQRRRKSKPHQSLSIY